MKKYLPPLLLIIIGLIYGLQGRNSMTLRVAFPYNKEISFYEPTKIHLAPEYIFLENIYSPLIELDPKEGTPSGGVAESYDWQENELHLYIRKDLKTIDGYEITAYDAEFSLKRLLVLSSNTHGNFKSVICPNVDFKDVDSTCDGIQVIDKHHLLLKIKGKKQFLAKMIATIDFAIIPKTSVDSKTLKIIDYRNTSGPFYVERSDDKGNIVLKPNPSHYHYSKSVAQEIVLVPSVLGSKKSSIDLFRENKVDHITTIDGLKADKIIDFSKEESSSFLHSSLHLRTFALFFTEKGLKRFSPEKRIAIGKTMRSYLQEFFLTKSGNKKRHQLFPKFGDGGLNSKEMVEVEDIFKNNDTVVKEKITLTTVRVGKVTEFQEALKQMKNVSVREGDVSDIFGGNPENENFPDIFIGGPDVSFMEDVGLISYTVNAGVIGIEKENRAKWLKEYMEIEDKKERIKLLKKVHKNALMKGFIIPYASSPYVALLRDGWRSELPEIVGNNLLWKIKKD